MIHWGQYSNIKIIKSKTIFNTLLFLFVQSLFSYAQIPNKITLQDSTKQDTVFVKPDSISNKIPQEIVREDTIFQKFMKFHLTEGFGFV